MSQRIWRKNAINLIVSFFGEICRNAYCFILNLHMAKYVVTDMAKNAINFQH